MPIGGNGSASGAAGVDARRWRAGGRRLHSRAAHAHIRSRKIDKPSSPAFRARACGRTIPTIISGRRSPVTRLKLAQPTILALSGGGAEGAFGAGLLTGWTARGTRPQFTFVTGASAGALIAPFAFLGPTYDETLSSVFASGEMSNLLQFEGLSGLLGTSLFKTAPLRDLIARHVGPEMLVAIAREHRAGRRLYVVTTNLDAQRSAIWDMGKIADSGDPSALELFRNVLTASASIPGVFSPVLIEVEGEGKQFAEMHVDGGVTTNVLIVPDAVLVTGTQLFAPEARPKIYRRHERQALTRLRRRESLDPADRDALVRDIGACQYPQHAARLLPVRQEPGLGVQSGLDRADLSEVRVDQLRPGLHAGIVRVRQGTGPARDALAIDAGGFQSAAAALGSARTARRRAVAALLTGDTRASSTRDPSS